MPKIGPTTALAELIADPKATVTSSELAKQDKAAAALDKLMAQAKRLKSTLKPETD